MNNLSLEYIEKFFTDSNSGFLEDDTIDLCRSALTDQFEKDASKKIRSAVKDYARAKSGKDAGKAFDIVSQLFKHTKK